MPLAPPVTIAVRPASLPMLLALSANPPGRLLAARELLFDRVDRGRIDALRVVAPRDVLPPEEHAAGGGT